MRASSTFGSPAGLIDQTGIVYKDVKTLAERAADIQALMADFDTLLGANGTAEAIINAKVQELVGDNILSGSYVPVFTDKVNIGITTITKAMYQRIQNIVHVAFMGTYQDVVAGQVSFNMSLPIASNFTSVNDLAGTASLQNGKAVLITADTNTAQDLAEFTWTDTIVGGGWISGVFQYEVK